MKESSVSTPPANPRMPPVANRGQVELDPVAEKLRKRAFDLRRKGSSYPEIAAELAIPISTAFSYVDACWLELAEIVTRENAAMLRDQELENLAKLEAKYLPLALQEDPEITGLEAVEIGMKAVDRVLKIQERRSKLLGLEAPQKMDVASAHLTLAEAEKRVREAEE
jgi:hypothetical protein